MKFTIRTEIKQITSPTIAYVIPFVAFSTLLSSPAAKIYIIPLYTNIPTARSAESDITRLRVSWTNEIKSGLFAVVIFVIN